MEEIYKEIKQLKERIVDLENELSLLKRNKRKEINNITNTDIILTDTLNDKDKYKICIMSGNLIVEKVKSQSKKNNRK